MRNVLSLILLAGCVTTPSGEEENSSALILKHYKYAVLACDPQADFQAECADMESSLQLLGWIVRRPGELTSDYFPTTGAPASYSETYTIKAGEPRDYSFVAASAGTTVDVTITGSGDADLYVRAGAPPTTSVYDCRPYTTSSNESCHIAGGQLVYVMVQGYGPTSTYTININYTKPQTTIMDLITRWVNASVHSGDQFFFYINAHGGSQSNVENTLSDNPQFPFPYNESGAYAAGPITSDRWASMPNWQVGTTAATYSGNGVQSWDVHELVKKLMGMNVRTTVVARDCYDGAFMQMFEQEYGNSPQLCVVGSAGPYVTSLTNTANASGFLDTAVANPSQHFSMDDLRRFIASVYESNFHGNPARNESSGFSNGCMPTINYRTVAQMVYNALGSQSQVEIQGGSVPDQPSYVIAHPMQFTMTAPNPAVPSSNPTASRNYHYQDGLMNWLSQTGSRLLSDIASVSYLTQTQRNGISFAVGQYASVAATERTAWDGVDTALRQTVGLVPQYSSGLGLDLYAQLLTFSQTGMGVDVFIRRMLETNCLCGTTYKPQSALDCSGSNYGAAEADLSCANPMIWINDVLAFYPSLNNATYAATLYRSQTAGAMQLLTASLVPIEQGCSSNACTAQTF